MAVIERWSASIGLNVHCRPSPFRTSQATAVIQHGVVSSYRVKLQLLSRVVLVRIQSLDTAAEIRREGGGRRE